MDDPVVDRPEQGKVGNAAPVGPTSKPLTLTKLSRVRLYSRVNESDVTAHWLLA
jgi:hypothetical protein